MLAAQNVSPVMWGDNEKEMASTADISQLLDMLPEPAAESSKNMATENDLADASISLNFTGADSGQSSSGSGASSPQYKETSCDTPLPGAPSKQVGLDLAVDDLDMWDMLTALDGTGHGLDTSATTEIPAAFEVHSVCVSPTAWAAAAEMAMPPITPLKPQAVLGKGAAKPKAEKAKGGSKLASKPTAAAPPPASAEPSKASAAAAAARNPPSAAAAGAMARTDRAALQELESGEDPLDDIDGDGLLPLDDAALDDVGPDDESESAEDKRLKRMRRNRESAAMSRNRKKQYVEDLEAQVASLNEAVRSLQSQNLDLRRECTRARGALSSSSPPPLPLPSPLLIGSSTLALPEPPMPPDLALLDDLVAPTPVHASHKRAGSPLLGGTTKRTSVASLALMSAVTFVTLSLGGRVTSSDGLVAPSSHAHSPGARMLMSLDELATQTFAAPSSVASLLARTARAPAPVDDHDDHDMLWPSLNLKEPVPSASTYSDPATMLPPPHGDDSHIAPAHEQARGYAERVIRAPQNSSWGDVLRLEAAEKQLAEAQLALKSLGVHRPYDGPAHAEVHLHQHDKHAPSAPLTHSAADAKALAAPLAKAAYHHMADPVFEPSWKSEDDLSFEDEHGYDPERYIFCSRTYMFDAVHPAAIPRRTTSPAASEFELPSAMPARFRYAAEYAATRPSSSAVPQLTDGDNVNVSSSAHPTDPSRRLPVVNLLLPSAALQGVRDFTNLNKSGDAHAGSDRNELMQVQCQVLKASPFGA